MKILVYDVAATEGGALTILRQTYQKAREEFSEIEWKFVVSTPVLENADNITVENYPDVKKSWFRRLKFDRKTIQTIIDGFQPDYILNLQNVAVKTRVPQIVYLHQSLPFVDHRFTIFEPKMWIYQNLIGARIKRRLRLAERVIVQTQWMQEAAQKFAKDIPVIVLPPETKIPIRFAESESAAPEFYFYPANASPYKDHATILRACRLLKKKGTDVRVVFTLKGTETRAISKMKKICEKEKLNIEWIGAIPREEVFAYYAKSVLLFPSFIETYGLPLAEARACGREIIAANTPFAREILNSYRAAKFFPVKDFFKLAGLMEETEKACCK